MGANLSVEKAKEKQEELKLNFALLCDYAKKNNVSAIIVAGDLFDFNGVGDTLKNFVISNIRNYAEINFFILLGNHDDKIIFTSDLPNLHLFENKFKSYKIDNVVITGANIKEFGNEQLINSLILEENYFNIVTLHGTLSAYDCTNISYGINKNALMNKSIDYLALGHYHELKMDKLDNRGVWAYSGCLAGRGFDESGDKGFILIDTNKRNYDFIIMNNRKFVTLDFDLSQFESFTDFSSALIDTVSKRANANDLIKVTLVGNYDFNFDKDINFLNKKLNALYYFAKIKDESHLRINASDYDNDISLKGEFIKVVKGNNEISKEMQNDIIELGLKAIIKGEC